MEFKKYASINNIYRIKTLDKIRELGYDKPNHLYEVTEKIHGANFSFWTDGKTVKAAKRTSFLNETDNFNNHQELLEEYRAKVLWLHTIIERTWQSKVHELTIFGELFGGCYPHPDVTVNPHAKKVQKGVFYTPNNAFIAFDLKINGKYFDLWNARKACVYCDIPFTEVLYTGTLDECLKYPNDNESTIYKRYGLPKIEDNVCEGIVISPIVPKFLYNNDRVILKNKNERFTEKQKETPKWKKDRMQSQQKELSADLKVVLGEMINYVTENRLRNVLSKIGPVTQKDFGKIMKEFNQDVLDDYQKDTDNSLNLLEKADLKLLTKRVNQVSAVLLRRNFINIIDGEF